MIDRTVYTRWRKTRRSGGGDNCVEVAVAPDHTVGVRDSKDPNGPILVFTAAQWTAFTTGLHDGQFKGH